MRGAAAKLVSSVATSADSLAIQMGERMLAKAVSIAYIIATMDPHAPNDRCG